MCFEAETYTGHPVPSAHLLPLPIHLSLSTRWSVIHGITFSGGCRWQKRIQERLEKASSGEVQGLECVHNVIRLMRTCINGNGCNKLQICKPDIFTMCAHIHCIVRILLHSVTMLGGPSSLLCNGWMARSTGYGLCGVIAECSINQSCVNNFEREYLPLP